MAEHRSPYRPTRPVTRPVRVDPTGRAGPTPGAARGPRWRRVAHGWYVPSTVDGSVPEQRVAEAVPSVLAGGGLTGWAALLLHGAAFLDGTAPDGRTRLPVQVRLPVDHHRDPLPGTTVVRGDLRRTTLLRGLPCASVQQAVLDGMRLQRDRREAVVLLDMTLAARITDLRQVRRLVESRSWRGVPGVPTARWALDHASQASASPPETRYRLVWTLDAGLARPVVNQPVFDLRGRLLGYPDLLDPVTGLVGEYDGEDHRRSLRHSHDVSREATFRRHGLEVTRATSWDLRDREVLADRIREAHDRARSAPPGRRLWTLTAPPDW